jgi:hypothetical protein
MGPKQGNLDSHQSFNDDDDDLYGHKYEAMYGADVRYFYINSLEVNVCGNGIYIINSKK